MNNSLVLMHPGLGRLFLVPKVELLDLSLSSPRFLRSKLLYESGQYRRCISYLNDSDACSPHHDNLRSACYIRLKDYKTAIRLLKRIQTRSEVTYNIALCLYAMDRCGETLAILDGNNMRDFDAEKLRTCAQRKLGMETTTDLSKLQTRTSPFLFFSKPCSRLPSASRVRLRPNSSVIYKLTSRSQSLLKKTHIKNVLSEGVLTGEETGNEGKCEDNSAEREQENIILARKLSQTLGQKVDDRKKTKEKKMHWAKKFVFSAVTKGKPKSQAPPTPPGLKMRDMDTHRNSFVVDMSIFEDIKQTESFVLSQQSQALFPSSNPYRDFSADGFKRLSYYTTLKVIEEFRKPVRDLSKLYEYLKETKFLSRFYPELGKMIIAMGALHEIEQGQVVFRQNEPGLHLYMIIRGSVEVVKIADEFGRFPLVVASIYDGDVFGDYSIVKAGLQLSTHLRSADCRAAEHCWIMKVQMEDYLQVMNSYHMAHLEDQLKFLCQLAMFQGAENLELCIMADHLESKDYRLEEVILDKGETPEKLYLIMSGRVLATGKIRTRTLLRDYKSGFIARIRDIETSSPMATGQYFGETSIIDNPVPSATRFTAWSGNVRILMMKKEHTLMIPEPLRTNFFEYIRKGTHYEQRIPNYEDDREEEGQL